MDSKKIRNNIKIIVQVSLLIALAIVTRNFSYMVYFGGAAGMRIGFSGVFTYLAAMLFGPLYGAAAFGIVDLIGYFLNPLGPFLPLLTATAILNGAISGFLWKKIRDRESAKLKRNFFIAFIVIGMIGVFNHISVTINKPLFWVDIINNLDQKKNFTIIGLEIASLAGLGLLGIDKIVNRVNKKTKTFDYYFKILLATGISGIIVTTLNTYILQIFVPELGKKLFLVFWVTRLSEQIIMTVIQGYIISIIYTVYRKITT